jgi:3-hydroxyisobutyrate dehydrogenase-like beta-hydroxyacid dehydrogenase
MKVGFIGLGKMGSAMAANIREAGHDLTVYNRTRERAERLAAQGAKVASTVGEACRGQEVVFTMLADDAAVESVVFGDDGVLATLPKGAIHVSSSTISVALAERLTAEHSQRGQQFISAPVFGRPEAAAEAKLFILPAGPRRAIEVAAPLFQAVAQKMIIVSDMPKAANLVKLSGNFLITSVIEALGEAMALVRKLGIDSHQYVDILTSTLFGAPVYKTYGKLIADGKFEPAGFAATLGEKDIRLTLAAGESLRVPLPIASLVRDRFLNLLANGGDTLDWSAIGSLPAREAGLPPK